MPLFLRTIKAAVLVALLGFSLPVIPAHTTTAAELSIYFLDVGQGDATILHQPGSCAMLIDTGPLINGHKVTRKLGELGINTIDTLIITHPHLDHFGGLFDIAPRLSIARFFDNGAINKNREYFDDYLLLRQGLPYQQLTRGDDLTCGDIRVSVLNPEDRPTDDDLNGGSLALLISYGDFRLLHMGDLAGPAVDRLLKRGDNISAPLLKVAHHGAADAASTALLKRVEPSYAIISSARDNPISSPSAEVLKRLSDNGVSYFRTDRDGTIRVLVNHDGYTIVSP